MDCGRGACRFICGLEIAALRWSFRLLILLGSVALGLPTGAAASEHDTMLQQAHAWARFGKGAWRQVRILTQNFDDQGQATDSSLTDNKTTVVDVTPVRVTLKVEVTVEVAGQRFPSQPQIIMQGYAGETTGDSQTTKPLDPETLTIDGRAIRCENQQIEIAGGVTREVNLITFAPQHHPAILRRKSTLSDATGNKLMQEVTSEVKALNMSRRVLDEAAPKAAHLVRLEQKNDRGTTITWSWHVPEIPGEVVDQCSQKSDSAGHLVRRTMLELVGYGTADVEEVETQDVPDAGSRRTRRKQRRMQ
jgi:hypothetical protein